MRAPAAFAAALAAALLVGIVVVLADHRTRAARLERRATGGLRDGGPARPCRLCGSAGRAGAARAEARLTLGTYGRPGGTVELTGRAGERTW